MHNNNNSAKTLRMDIPQFILRIINRLHHSGFHAYVTGGAIRDTYLQRPVTDWDVTTSASRETIQSLFSDIRTFSLKHDTVTVMDASHHCEVTPFRGSGKQPSTIMEDLGHRDFTIDAMAFDIKTGKILDPHEGCGDIQRKIIKAVGNPEDRFLEDPIRLLRAVRIAHELGFRIERDTLQRIVLMADRLVTIAPERIRDEFMKILLSRRPSAGFYLLKKTGLFRYFFPEILEGYRKIQNAHHRYTIYRHIMETVDCIDPDPVLRLTALFHDIAKPRVRKKMDGQFRYYNHERMSAKIADNVMKRLRFSNKMIVDVIHLILHHMIEYDSEWTDGAVRRLIRRVGPENMSRLISFRKADLMAHGKDNPKMDLLLELEERVCILNHQSLVKSRRDLALNGKKVMEILGLSPGPEVGNVLNKLLEEITDHPECNTEEELIALMKSYKHP